MRLFRLTTLIPLALLILSGCATRQVQDSLSGSTAQRLLSYSIDQLVDSLPADDFEALRGQRVWLATHFIEDGPLKRYADQRLVLELEQRFDIQSAANPTSAEAILNVFYTSLGTDEDIAGFYLPLGAIPGVNSESRINLISLEKFHGVAEMYYFIERDGVIARGPTLISRTKSDALGLPIITIPLSNLPEGDDSD